MRGTITELVPGERVTLLLPSGEARQIAMAEVEWAGPAAEMPVRAPAPQPAAAAPVTRTPADDRRPFVTVHGPEARLQLQSDDSDITFHLAAGDAIATSGSVVAVGRSYTPICTAPCEASLPAGTHYMALSTGGDTPVDVEDPVVVHGPSVLEASYDSRAGTRAAGWIIFIGGQAVGIGVMLVPLLSVDGGDFDTTPIFIGGGIALASLLVGLLLRGTSDDASIEVHPLSAQEPGAPGIL